jgi:predicted RNA binding protein YcfA (HicA-like mRNA interferase family)
MPKLYSSEHIIKILLKKGFIQVSQRGSHKKFRQGDKIVIVPDPKKEIPMGTFHSILRQSGLKKEDFED